MSIKILKNPIDVHCEKGYGKCIAWIDYGIEVNTVWKIRLYDTGKIINVLEDEIIIYPNPMNGEPKIKIPEGWNQ